MEALNLRKTRAYAINKTKEWNSTWRRMLKEYAAGRSRTKADRRRLEALMGLRAYSGPIRASDIPAALQFSLECVDVVHAYQKAVPDLRWFHITLLANEFVVSERDPSFALKRLKGKADKQLRELALDGLAFIDVNALPNYPGKGGGGSFLFHVHVVAFTDHHDFEFRRARKALQSSRSWSSKLGGKPTHIREITDVMGEACWWAAYDSKAPHEAKNFVEAEDGSVKLMSTQKGYRPNVAMRLEEGFSHLALRDRVFSVGDAKELRDDIMRRLARWHRRRWQDQKPVKDFDVKAFWKRWWKRSRTKDYQPWEIIGSTL